MNKNIYTTIMPEYIGHAECVQFDIMDECAVLNLFYYDPTLYEMLQVRCSDTFDGCTI